jgi:ketosteroid isomerase-like protein
MNNLELVRGLYEEGAASPLTATRDQIDEAFRTSLDERFEVRLPPDYPEGEPVFRGREGFDRMVAMLQGAWGQWRLEPQEFLDAGDRVVVFARLLVEGEASGIPVEIETTHVWTVRGGRATSMHAFRNRSEALEAAGLQE